MNIFIPKVLAPIGISLFSAGIATGGVVLWTSKEIKQAKLERENPNILTLYKKNPSGYLVIGNSKEGRWEPSPKSSISFGEKGWQYENQGIKSEVGKDFFHLKGENAASSGELLTNSNGIESQGDLSGSLKVYFSASNCKYLNKNSENFWKFNPDDAGLKGVFQIDKKEENKSGFAFLRCIDKK